MTNVVKAWQVTPELLVEFENPFDSRTDRATGAALVPNVEANKEVGKRRAARERAGLPLGQYRSPRSRRAVRAALGGLALVLFAAGCGGSDAGTTAEESSNEVAAAEPTAVEESPTAVEPDPTATAAPEPEPSPTPAPEPTETATVLPQGDFSAVAAVIEAFVEERGLNGAGLAVVTRDDGLVYHEHFGEFTEDRISLIASSSKMISAGVLLRLQEQGLLDIDAPISDVVPWAGSSGDITVAQLLSNSSGLVGLLPDVLFAPYACQWLPTGELEKCGEAIASTTGDDDKTVAPDTEFRYGGGQWQLAGAIAEAASGKTWAELIEEIYVEPCDVGSLGYISIGSVADTNPGYPTRFAGDPDALAPSENPNIEAGVYTDSGDYATLLLMHLRGGVCDGGEVLTQASLDTMHQDRIGAVYQGDANADAGLGYGMGWWIDRESGRISDPGLYGAVPWLDFDDGYGVYLVIEDTTEAGLELAALIGELVHTAVVG